MTPIVLIYQGWTYWVFRKRINTSMIPAEPQAGRADDRFRRGGPGIAGLPIGAPSRARTIGSSGGAARPGGPAPSRPFIPRPGMGRMAT